MNPLIADDNSMIQGGVRRRLSSNPDISVWEASSGGSAKIQIEQDDIRSSRRKDWQDDSSGLELLRHLLGEDSGARVLIFRMYSEPINLLRGLKAGASAYIRKSADPEELLAAIRRVEWWSTRRAEDCLTSAFGQPVRATDDSRVGYRSTVGGWRKSVNGRGRAWSRVQDRCNRVRRYKVMKSKLGLRSTSDPRRLTSEMGRR